MAQKLEKTLVSFPFKIQNLSLELNFLFYEKDIEKLQIFCITCYQAKEKLLTNA